MFGCVFSAEKTSPCVWLSSDRRSSESRTSLNPWFTDVTYLLLEEQRGSYSQLCRRRRLKNKKRKNKKTGYISTERYFNRERKILISKTFFPRPEFFFFLKWNKCLNIQKCTYINVNGRAVRHGCETHRLRLPFVIQNMLIISNINKTACSKIQNSRVFLLPNHRTPKKTSQVIFLLPASSTPLDAYILSIFFCDCV